MAVEQGGGVGADVVSMAGTLATASGRDARPGSAALLIVDDDDNLRTRLKDAMNGRGYVAREAATGAAALAIAAQQPLDFAVVDLRLPDMNGLELIRRLKAASPATRLVVLTGYGSIATALEAVRLGASDYLAKPVDADEVTRALKGSSGRSDLPRTAPSLARVEWEHINRVLVDCEGNVSATARVLGLHRRSLQRKLAKFPNPR